MAPTTRRPQARGLVTRARCLTAAETLFTRRGFDFERRCNQIFFDGCFANVLRLFLDLFSRLFLKFFLKFFLRLFWRIFLKVGR